MKEEKIYFDRKIDGDLRRWKESAQRKPLLLRGARQVGKSSSVRQFGKTFANFVEINFEQQRRVHEVFAADLLPREICQKLSWLYGQPIEPGVTLLFFDEIQACPNAVAALRFFYEDYPQLHLIAAGSLLEFALASLPSFGVGRIESLFMYPFSFYEFLGAIGEGDLVALIGQSSPERPVFAPVHQKLLDRLKTFMLIGGMPETVAAYSRTGDLLQCSRILSSLVTSLKSDFAKYKKRVPELRLSAVFNAVANQMGQKFVYAKAGQEYNTRQIKESLELLRMAGLIIPVVHTSANGIPIGADMNPKYQKFLFLDSGIYQNIHGLDLSDIVISNDFQTVNKGSMAELYAGLELIKAAGNHSQAQLYCWARESKNSNAEIDYLIQKGNDIIPVEIKSGSRGSMQSLALFMKEKGSAYGIRCSLENFGQLPGIEIYPLYAVASLYT